MARKNTETSQTEEEGDRGFTHLLAQVAEGQANTDLSKELHDLCRIMRAEARARDGKVSGKLTLLLKFTTDERGAVDVDYSIRIAKPDPARPRSLFFFTKDSNLSSEYPKQQALPLVREVKQQDETRDLPAEQTEAREV